MHNQGNLLESNSIDQNMSAVLFKRLVFQVGDSANERTFTLSSVSKNGHFISLRPFTKPTEDEKKFPLEWVFAGTNDRVKVTPTTNADGKPVLQQDFDMGFDTNVYLNVENTHRGVINTFWQNWESGCVEETGKVFPFGKDKEGIPFMELWQPIDPNSKDLVILDAGDGRKIDGPVRSTVLKVVDGQDFEGLMIIVGEWAQGYLADKNKSSVDGLSFVRYHVSNEKLSSGLFEYGSQLSKFPNDFSNVKEGSVLTIDGLKWEVIEN